MNHACRQLTLLFFLCLAAIGCAAEKTAALATPTPIPTPVVPRKPVYEVVRGDVVEEMQFSGRVVPVVEQALAFEREGRVGQLYVAEGEQVAAGDLLADLEQVAHLIRQQEEQQLAVRRARLHKEIAALRLEAFRLTAEGETADYEQQVGILERQVELADIALQEAELTLEDLGAGVASAQLAAPLDGVVHTLSLQEGQQVAAFEPVAVVADMGALEVSAGLTSGELALLEEGMPVLLEPARGPGSAFTGTVRRLPYAAGGGSVELGGSDDAVRISLAAPAAEVDLAPGDRVRATVVLAESADTLWLPPQAIRSFGGRNFVIVQEGEGQQRVDVSLGIQGDGRVEVLSGLSAGQRVVGP